MTNLLKDTPKFKNLLILAPSYPNEDNTFIRGIFIKKQLDYLKLYFENVYVIAPVLNCFKISPKDKLCTNYIYDNIKVYYPRCFYVPIFHFNKILIDNRLHVVKTIIKKENLNFDLIHAHFTWPSGYIGAKLKEEYKKPVVITIHENEDWFNKEIKMNHFLLNYSWENADAIIRVNERNVPSLKKFNNEIFSIPNGFSPNFKPLDKNECRNKLSLPSDKYILFSLGWLIERKGFRYLIDAMHTVEKERSDVLCYIGGAGPLKNKLQKQIERLNLVNKVKLIGFVSDESLPLWMSACDVFVLPSLSESFGVVIIEAMACGKPVITTCNGGSEELVISQDMGFVVEVANSSQLAEKILVSLDQQWDNSKIINHANQYNWECIINKIITVYNGIR